MENVKITGDSIVWDRFKKRLDSDIYYKSTILNHGDHISIYKEMFIDGEFKRSDLTHIPIELIDEIKKLVNK